MTICHLQQRDIFLTARTCVGSPFRHQGRSPAQGLDCVGLIVYTLNAIGLKNVDFRDYKKIPVKNAISSHAGRAGFTQKAKSDMTAGDLVIMRFGRYIEHAVIVSDRGIIHACEKYGKVVEHSLDMEWQSKIISVYKFPNIIK